MKRSGRLPGIIFVVVLHVLLIYALASGLGSAVVELLPPDLQAAVIQEAVEDDAPPPPPPPDFEPPPPFVPPPDFAINLAPAAPTTTAITNVTNEVRPPPPPPPEPIVPPKGNANRNVVTADDYPPVSLRLQEQGRCIVELIVTVEGRASEVKLLTSSGSDRLDDACVNIVQRKFRYTPATQGGKPVQARMQQPVTFQIR